MKRVLAAMILLAIAGCASTPSVPIGPGPAAGFAEEKLSSTRYRITYTATRPETADQMSNRVLAHAAQLTLDKGNQWFEIASRIEGKNTETLVVVMGQGETLAGGKTKTYDAKDTLNATKSALTKSKSRAG
ncbi:MAG TPA: hypothetical protein VG942_16290 [Hyphomonadaceae bacterium]|nr:hypothetical protein [Hyphomonadaceae bacterium]